MSKPRHPIDDFLRSELEEPRPNQEEALAMDHRFFASLASEEVTTPEVAVIPEQVEAPVLEPEWPGVSTQRRPTLVALGSAAAVFLIALPVILWTQSAEESSPGPVGSPVTAPPAPDTTTPETPEPSLAEPGPTPDSGWGDAAQVGPGATLVHTGDEFLLAARGEILALTSGGWEVRGSLNGEVLKLVAKGDHLVAMGLAISNEPYTAVDAVWVSDDRGASWELAQIDGAVKDIAHTPTGFVAVGFVSNVAEGHRPTTGALWTSEDGSVWARAALSEDPVGHSSTMDAVVWSDGLLVLGQGGPHQPTEGTAGPEPVEWASLTWRGADAESLRAAAASNLIGHIQDAVASPSGVIALTYWSTMEQKDNSGAWISNDGVSWSQLRIDDGNWEYSGVSLSGTELLISAYTLGSGLRTVENRIWRSNDASEWHEVEPPLLTGGPPLRLYAIAHVGDEVVVRASADNRHLVFTGTLNP